MKRANSRRRILRGAAALLALALIAACAVYLNTYYVASPEALRAVSAPAEGVTVEADGNRIAFIPDAPRAGLVFYPGGKVQCEAYAPLMERCAQEGILCVLLRMPFNLAVFAPDAAGGVAAGYPQVGRWFIGGHSLGGVMASRYAAAHADEWAGVALLASYSTENLRGSGLAALTLTGSEDGVLNRKAYEKARANLPADAWERVLPGGNHAQFGSYGLQRGDGVAAIAPEAQWDETAHTIMEWMAAAAE